MTMTPNEAAACVRQRLEEALPGLARSWYVTGSVADGTAGPASDLDLVAITRDDLGAGERETIGAVTREVANETGMELDLELVEASVLADGADPQLKLGSRLLHGEDVVAAAPIMPIDEWARRRMHAAYYLMVSAFGRPPAVREPLDYPRPDDPFFGYALRDVLLPDGTRVPSTRNLVRVSGWIATALVAWSRATYVVRKSDCHLLYRREIGDAWSDLVDRIDTRCRRDWQYLIPSTDREQEELRSIGEEMLRFERHFLALYRRFLLQELAAGGNRSERARWVMEQIPFEDGEVLTTLSSREREAHVSRPTGR